MALRKTRDSDCCSVNFLKYVLHIFNIVFLMAGCAVLAVGIWTVVSKQQYVVLLSTATYAVAAWVLIVAGVLALIVSVVGCCGVWREERCLLLMYTFLLLLIFLLEAMVGILSYAYETQVENELRLNLNTTFLEGYHVDPDKTTAINLLQRQHKCCGAQSYEDWKYSEWKKLNPGLKESQVPDSCCKTYSENCGKSDHPSNIYHSDCLLRLAEEIKVHLRTLGGVGLGLCVVEIFGMVFSCCLYIKLKDVID